ncbi:ABC transporter permease [Rugosimonospora acidiphila]|uniref:ABC transporter permease n=1 Tax=Rugosimonospora acidiphila TaxID=556531 RepID=A0ABP9RN62_9ACTN
MLRATLKSLTSRKLRLVLSGLAVVLGVMFVAGAFVLTDTLGRSFTSLFQTAYAHTDVQVSAKSKLGVGLGGDQGIASLPGSLIDKVRQVPGVASATGTISVDGARVVGANGKAVTTYGAPQFGTNWTGTGTERLEPGSRAPAADDEIAINAGLAKTANLRVGQRVGVLTLRPQQTFTVVGIFGYSGGRDSLGGEQTVAFTTPVAQRLMLGAPGAYSAVDVRAGPGVDDGTLRDRVAAAVGGGYQVQTGKQLAHDAAAGFQKALSFFNYVLLGFAGVALFVGVFLILNTFSIIVAQRVRELALMRSLGASRRQIISSVLLEALVIGLIASVLGLGAGVGVGALLAFVFAKVGASGLHLAGVGVPASAVIASFAVGILVTLVAAMLPALRASRVAPIAALREVAATDRPLTRITISGGAITALGAGVLALGLTGGGGDGTLWAILGGVLISFIGVALLTPLISRPVVSGLGRLFAWSVPGQLGRRNSARNPRRTAITAAALMVGLALITGVNVILSSATASIHQVADSQVSVDLIISGDGGASSIVPTFDRSVLDRVRATPGVAQVAGVYGDSARVDGDLTSVDAVDNPAGMRDMFDLKAKSGTIATIGSGQLILDQKRADSLGLRVGSRVPVQLSRGDVRTFTISGIYADNDVYSGWVMSAADVSGFRTDQPEQALIKLAPGTSVAGVKAKVDTLLANSPEVNVADRTEYVDQQAAQLNTVLTMIQILLALAILIAVLGIINTLALSVLERTRELGLLRAIGLRRAQTMRMVTVEAVVISVFGALLGLAVGSGLGAAVVRALHDQGFTTLSFPWGQLAVYLVLAGIVGVVAAILPAIRAARVNVLAAIAYE